MVEKLLTSGFSIFLKIFVFDEIKVRIFTNLGTTWKVRFWTALIMKFLNLKMNDVTFSFKNDQN